ncbi:MAG: AAA family ATPase [Proteobacteria bacterium]|nr:AAA family ATPase [Pseudomonadota bacterium]
MSRDVSVDNTWPKVLVGRQKEKRMILNTFVKVQMGANETVLVKGDAGIGKTAIISDLAANRITKEGFFITGKCGQYLHNSPYESVIQAFTHITNQILTGRHGSIVQWKEDLIETLGENGRLITEVIPGLEQIIGRQPETDSLNIRERRNRFHQVFKKFIRVFARKTYPLTLFLDDLQWIDHASLSLMESVVGDPTIEYFLFIGAYRDNEVDASHSLTSLIRKIEASGCHVHFIELSDLNAQETHQLVGCLLKSTNAELMSLSSVVWRKTGGNPFFINQFINRLHDTGLIFRDKNLDWAWDIEKINLVPSTDNVLAFLKSKIDSLTEPEKRTLDICACLGSPFDLELLSGVDSHSMDLIYSHLYAATAAGLIDMENEQGCFLHDQIMEAIYSTIPATERQAIHHRIGRTLVRMNEVCPIPDKIFFMTDQLNHGAILITDTDEKTELIRYNLECAKKAKASSAYLPAYEYLEKSISLLPSDSWETQHELTMDAFTECVEVSCLKGDYARMYQLANIALAHAESFLDKIDIYKAEVHACIAQEDFIAALTIGVSLQGVISHYPLAASPWDVFREYARLRVMLLGKNIDSLINLPEMTDPAVLKTLEVGSSLGIALYSKAPKLLSLYVILSVQNALKYGKAPEHPICFFAYGAMLISVFGDIKNGCKFGTLGIKLAEHPHCRKYMSMFLCVYNCLIRHWKEPIRNTLEDFIDGYRYGLESGDLFYAALNLCVSNQMAYHAGVPLPQIEQSIREKNILIKSINQKQVLTLQKILWQAILNRLEPNDDPTQLMGNVFNEKTTLPFWQSTNNRLALAILYNAKLNLEVEYHKYTQALSSLSVVKKYRKSVSGFIVERDIPYYDALIRLGLYPTLSYAQKKICLIRVRNDLKILKKMVTHAPANNLHRFYLVKAECARILNRKNKAETYYDLALTYAREYKYIHEEGQANELAARYYFSMGKDKIGARCINDAYQCYREWGNISKLGYLEKNYEPYLFMEIHASLSSAGALDPGSQSVNLSKVFKESQDIAEEVAYPKLLEKMMRITISNMEAEKGYMILLKHNHLFIEAEGHAGSEDFPVLQSIPIDEHTGLSKAIVHACAQSIQPILLNNARSDGPFVADPYIVVHKPKSIYCFPILHKDELMGILYFENNLIMGAFTPAHRKSLDLLAAQIAISIENTRLYEQLEETVTQRSKELRRAINELNKEAYKRKLTEEELCISNFRLAKVLDTTSDTIIVINYLRDIIFYNKGAENLFSYTPAEIMHQPVNGLFPMDQHSSFETHILSLTALTGSGDKNEPILMDLQRKDGTRLRGSLSLAALSIDDEPYYSLIINPVIDMVHQDPSPQKPPNNPMVYPEPKVPVDSSKISETVDQMAFDFDERLAALDYAIKDISHHLSPLYIKESEIREKISELLTMTLMIWENSTKKTKIDLAEESGIWKAYCDGGTWRTRTMDKYLDPDTIPERPRYNNVMKTVDFVLKSCAEDTEQIRSLKKAAQEMKGILLKKGYKF